MNGHRRAARALLLGAGLSAMSGCRHSERAKPSEASAGPSARASSVPQASNAAPARTAATPVPFTHGCRVLGVKGKTPPAGTPSVGTLLREREWIEVAEGVELQLKHSETTRELSLLGPGRFLPCFGGAEAVLIASGALTTTPGPGSRAGAEVELGTPFGVVHYADAGLRLEVSEGALTLTVKQGAATVSATEKNIGAEKSAAEREPESVRGPKGQLVLTGSVDAGALAVRCTDALEGIVAKTAETRGTAGNERRAWAISMLERRKATRFACSRARAAAGRKGPEERARLEDQMNARPRLPNAETDPRK